MISSLVSVLVLSVLFTGNVQNVSAKSRIVGGYLVSIEQFPFMASLQTYNDEHWCGGAILSEKFIITAAHCFDSRNIRSVKVGVHNMNEPGIVREIEQVTLHPKYDPSIANYDIAVVELEEPLKFIPGKVMPINLPSRSKTVPVTSATVLGWGETQHYAEDKSLLRAVDLEIWSQKECKNSRFRITRAMFCALHISGTGDSCQGDSGGPLVIDDVLYGIVSHGESPCANGADPGVYTNVPYLVDWVKEQAHLHWD